MINKQTGRVLRDVRPDVVTTSHDLAPALVSIQVDIYVLSLHSPASNYACDVVIGHYRGR